MTKFNFLLDQIKGPDVKAVLTILQTAKSKSIQVIEIIKIHMIVEFEFESFYFSAMESFRQ